MSKIAATTLAVSIVFGAAAQIREEQFTVLNPLDSVLLSGTLSMPAKESPKAVIVLATGSGLQDRDETIGRHKPFKEIADYLASNGFAVARTDDRGYSTTAIDTALLQRSSQWDELADYRSVISAMKKRDSFKGLKVGMLGHSLGGSEAIMAFSRQLKASRYNAVGSTPEFIVTLAAPAVSGDSLVLDQVRQQLRLQGAEYAYEMYKEALSKRYAMAKSYLPAKSLRIALFDDVKATLPPGTALNDELKAEIDTQIDLFCSPAYREMLRYSPEADIAYVDVPWLALYGSKDMQVSGEYNASALRRAAQDKDNIAIRVLEDKNHLFQNAVTGSIEEYQKINGAISDDVLQEILEWLLIQFNDDFR